jgi:bidirectional [NiFe] hydrogenase diaphorase subunit
METPITGQSGASVTTERATAGRTSAGVQAASDRRYQQLDRALRQSQFRQDSLIEILHTAQELFGYLSEDVLLYVARNLKVPTSQVYGVATFYNFFSLEPKGKHTCTVCLGTACYVKGAANILAALSQNLGIGAGKTTPDGLISLEGARCLGACGLAPAVVFDGEIGAQMTPEKAVARIRSVAELPVAGGSEE